MASSRGSVKTLLNLVRNVMIFTSSVFLKQELQYSHIKLEEYIASEYLVVLLKKSAIIAKIQILQTKNMLQKKMFFLLHNSEEFILAEFFP